MTIEQFKIPKELLLLQKKLLDLRKNKKLLLQNGDCGLGSAPSNIALIKYWGKSKTEFQIPDNPSLSFTLENFRSHTRVTVLGRFFPENEKPDFIPPHEFYLIDLLHNPKDKARRKRAEDKKNQIKFDTKLYNADVSKKNSINQISKKLNIFLQNILYPYAKDIGLKIESYNNFPSACGLASSASGIASLCKSIANLLNLEKNFSKKELQYWLMQWSRLGSGSAARSVCLKPNSKFVSWEITESPGKDTFIKNIAYHKHWNKLQHCVFVLNASPKEIKSSDGHILAHTSPLHAIRIHNVKENFKKIKKALLTFDYNTVSFLTEQDAFSMHAVMQTGTPPVIYLNHLVSLIISEFISYRENTKIKAFWTLDAGPNIHFLYLKPHRKKFLKFYNEISKKLNQDIKIYE